MAVDTYEGGIKIMRQNENSVERIDCQWFANGNKPLLSP